MENKSYTTTTSGFTTYSPSGSCDEKVLKDNGEQNYNVFSKDKYPTRRMTLGKVKYV